MTLEEQIRAYAAKGELVHLSLVATNGEYSCVFASASPGSGYASARDRDPIVAIEAAFKASPAKRARKVDPSSEDAKPRLASEDWTKP